MKNNFLTIVRARHKADIDTQALTTRLKRYAEITLVHLFKHEPVFLLFVATASIHEFPAFQQRLTTEEGIAECQYRHLSSSMRTILVPDYQPRTWLL